jgi:tyrosine aminotransferase
VPLASLTRTVPILSCSGIAKEFLVPGWRVGWVTVHDTESGALADIRRGLFALSQLILGANSLVVSAIPAILTPAPGSADAASLAAFRADTIAQLEANAGYCADRLAAIPGLRVVRPAGAMYLMFAFATAEEGEGEGSAGGVCFPSIGDDVVFAQKLLSEENVFVLPGVLCCGEGGRALTSPTPPPSAAGPRPED